MHGVNIYTDLGQQELPDCFHAKMNPMSCDLGQKIRVKYERFSELLYVGNIIQSHQVHNIENVSFLHYN